MRRSRSLSAVAVALTVALVGVVTRCGSPRPSVVARTASVDAAPEGDTSIVRMTLVNSDAHAVDIVNVLSPVAQTTAIFQHEVYGDTVRTTLLQRLPLPGRASSTFAPPGPHVMLAGLARALHEGDHVRLTVILSDGQPFDVDAVVRAPGAIMARAQGD